MLQTDIFPKKKKKKTYKQKGSPKYECYLPRDVTGGGWMANYLKRNTG